MVGKEGERALQFLEQFVLHHLEFGDWRMSEGQLHFKRLNEHQGIILRNGTHSRVRHIGPFRLPAFAVLFGGIFRRFERLFLQLPVGGLDLGQNVRLPRLLVFRLRVVVGKEGEHALLLLEQFVLRHLGFGLERVGRPQSGQTDLGAVPHAAGAGHRLPLQFVQVGEEFVSRRTGLELPVQGIE